ncbi:MAG: CRISPR system precrRNA processing endoribonuclease RAMP protein Cas6, partial [Promethearchaeota archaeon]
DHDVSWEFRDLLDAADTIKTTQKNLHWKDQSRYSNRQKRKMKMGGFVGEIELEGEFGLIGDLVKYSEVLHVGKGTTFGLGKVEIEYAQEKL